MCEIVYGDRLCPNNRSRGAWSHNGVTLKDNPGRKFKRHSDSAELREAELMITNTRIEAGLSRADKDTRNKKKASNELYISKLIKLTHFLARNNLPVKELYPKMVEFLSEEMEEPAIKQYLDSAAKNATYAVKDSWDSFLKAMNSYFSDQVNEELQAAEDIVVFADEATSNNRKEMMRVSVAYFSEKAKCFKLDFIGLFSVSSTKAEILLDKIKKCFLKEILICRRQGSFALMGPMQ